MFKANLFVEPIVVLDDGLHDGIGTFEEECYLVGLLVLPGKELLVCLMAHPIPVCIIQEPYPKNNAHAFCLGRERERL